MKTTEDQGEKQKRHLKTKSKKNFQTQMKNQSLLCFQKMIQMKKLHMNQNKIMEMENKLDKNDL